MRVAVLADFLEELWPSMDLVAESLVREFERENSEVESVELIRPGMRRRFSSVRGGPGFVADRILNRFFDYPRFLRRRTNDFDLFHVVDHSYSQLVHELPANRCVVTCHDVDTFRCLWEPAHTGRGLAFRMMTKRIASGMRKAAHVCCDSEATRAEVIDRELVPREKTSVVPLGVHPVFTEPQAEKVEREVDELLRPLNNEPGETVDVLHVGSTISRKRIDILLDVFADLHREDRRLRLVRVGGNLTPSQQDRGRRLGIADRVLTLPFITPKQLAAVYQRAALLLFPSEGEGFGFPVIEAMASRTPVLASDLPVLHEVGGSAADYALVGDCEDWVRKVQALLREREQSQARWMERRSLCRAQAAKFTWEETARRMSEVYREVLSSVGER